MGGQAPAIKETGVHQKTSLSDQLTQLETEWTKFRSQEYCKQENCRHVTIKGGRAFPFEAVQSCGENWLSMRRTLKRKPRVYRSPCHS